MSEILSFVSASLGLKHSMPYSLDSEHANRWQEHTWAGDRVLPARIA